MVNTLNGNVVPTIESDASTVDLLANSNSGDVPAIPAGLKYAVIPYSDDQKATINLTSTGVIVAAVAGKKIRVIAAQLSVSAALVVKWQSNTVPTDITGPGELGANGGYVLPRNPAGWFETLAGEALSLNISGSGTVGGSISYVLI